MVKKTLRDLAQGRSRCAEQPPDEAIDPNNVMPRQCSTCPWQESGGILADSIVDQALLRLQVMTNANQRCHSPGLEGKPETKICRGARDFQLQKFFEMGLLPEPSDRAWAETLAAIRKERGNAV